MKSTVLCVCLLLAPGALFAQGGSTRLRSQVEQILGPDTGSGPYTPLNLVIVWGDKDHGPGEHEYELFSREWSVLLGAAENVTVSTAYYWPTQSQWDNADVILFHMRTRPGLAQSAFNQMDAFLAAGKGLVVMHVANHPDVSYENEWADRTGLGWIEGSTTYRHGTVVLDIVPGTGHPILAGMPDTLVFNDEMYFPLFGHPNSIELLATANEQGQDQAALWTFSPGGNGRVYGFMFGHYHTSFSDPVMRILLLRGIAWAAGEALGRFRPTVLDGADYIDDFVSIMPLERKEFNTLGIGRAFTTQPYFRWEDGAWLVNGKTISILPLNSSK